LFVAELRQSFESTASVFWRQQYYHGALQLRFWSITNDSGWL